MKTHPKPTAPDIRRWCRLPACLAALLIGSTDAPAAELWIGASTTSITPDEPVALAGHRNLRISNKIESPITATALALESREGERILDQAIIVSCDLIAIRDGILDKVRGKLGPRLPGFDSRKLILCATHTHNGPIMKLGRYTLPETGVMKPDRYVEFMTDKVAEAAAAAWKARQPGKVAWGQGQAVVAHNRRAVYADGSAKMYGTTNAGKFRGMEAAEDHDLDVLFFWDGDDRLLATAINVACPAQEKEGGQAMHADFWHPVRENLRKRFGEDLHVLAMTGAAGDQVSRPQFNKRTDHRARMLRGLTPIQEIARRITNAWEDAYKIASKDIRDDLILRHHLDTIALPHRQVTEEEVAEARAQAAKFAKDPAERWNYRWHQLVVDRYEEQQKGAQEDYRMELHALRLGDVAIATNDFELFTEFGIRIKARSPAVQTFIVQLAGSGGYVPTERAVRGGGYSAVIQSSRVGPRGGQVLVDRTVEALKGIWDGKQAAVSRPNIILILCDNLGYGDTEVYHPGAKQPTPRIRQLAREGMVFTHAYAPAPVCTPSRAAVMTGCYPRRVGLDLAGPDARPVLKPVSRYGLHPDELTIAEILKQQGYRTICIGKWHLGDQPQFLPTRQGFDEFFGIPYSDDMTPRPGKDWPPLPLLEGGQVIEAPVDVNALTRRNTERALRFIEANSRAERTAGEAGDRRKANSLPEAARKADAEASGNSRPFFLYLPHIIPGSTSKPPASPGFQGKSRNGAWGDSVMELDWSTGRILDRLDELGLDKNTLVIWTNDNGAPAPTQRGGSNRPLKGDAYSVAEGGMRVPFIARWKGRIPAGTTCDALVTLMDLLPTFSALGGTRPPADRIIDGHDISPLLLGNAGARSAYRAFFYYYVNQLQAVRSGPWKLYLPHKRQLTGFGSRSRSSEGALYHLVEDPEENDNRFSKQPAIVKRLLALAEEARNDPGELDRPGSCTRPVGTTEKPVPLVLLPRN